MSQVLTNFDKEARRWEVPRSQGGMRPDGFEMFPKMLYKARKPPHGGPPICVDPFDERFSDSNQLTVGNHEELARAERDGWKTSPDEAVRYALGLEDDISRAAAERQTADRKLSEPARREAEAADEATFDHLPEIPPKPKRKYTRRNAPAA